MGNVPDLVTFLSFFFFFLDISSVLSSFEEKKKNGARIRELDS